jgi:hypothetical protein
MAATQVPQHSGQPIGEQQEHNDCDNNEFQDPMI